MLLLFLRWEVLGQAGVALGRHRLQSSLLQGEMYGWVRPFSLKPLDFPSYLPCKAVSWDGHAQEIAALLT